MDVGVLLPLGPRRAARTASLVVPNSQNLVPEVFAIGGPRERVLPRFRALMGLGGQLLPALGSA